MGQILVVDDDPDILHILTAAFECVGHRVVATLDPEEVQPLLGAQRFDAVILDVMMPRRSGWEVLEELRRDPHTERLPVVMLSAIGDSANRVRGIRLGADDFLPKPFDPEELVARVEGLIGRRAAAGLLQGDFASFPVGEVLQTLQSNATSGLLEVTTPGGSGWLRLSEGSCTDASYGGLSGADAVLALLGERAGHFLLYNPPGQPPSTNPPLPAVSRLLLEAAWIEDEVRARRELLPPEDRGLVAVDAGLALPVPAGLPDLVTAPVLDALAMEPGLSLSGLLQRRLAAPNRVRLTVACLVESGRVHEEGKPPARRPTTLPALDEELDALLGELAQESALRGFPVKPVEVTILVDPAARKDAERMLDLLAVPRSPHLETGALSEDISVFWTSGEVRLRIHPYSGSLPDSRWLRHSAALVLWLGEQPAEETIRSATVLEQQADPRAYRLAIAPGTDRPAADHHRLRILRHTPEDFTSLLGAILSPLVEVG